MASKKNSLPLLKELEIRDAGAEGKAVARFNNKVVFVPFAAPGDICDIQVTRKRKSYYEGRVVHYHRESTVRTRPLCRHFGLCGGCKWQHIQYQYQLEYKQKQVIDNLARIGKLEIKEVRPIIGSEKNFHYRNKLEFTFSNRRWRTHNPEGQMDTGSMKGLGFHLPGMFDRIIDVQECLLQDDYSNKIRNAIRDYTIQNDYSYFDVRNWVGLMRNLIIRNTSIGEWMAIVVFNDYEEEMVSKLMKFIESAFPELNSLMYVINSKRNPDISDLEVKLFSGNPYVFEEMEGLRFKIGPKSFFQTNTQQASKLYQVVMDFGNFRGDEKVLDLYSGTGTIANFIAGKVKHVTGIEYVAEAVEDARENSNINRIKNTSFYAGDILQVINDGMIKEMGKPDVIITDPPRAGMHEKVVQKILELSAQRIIYISCNPATQARDLAMMKGQYSITKIQPVDMFPHTQHVENVTLLERLPDA